MPSSWLLGVAHGTDEAVSQCSIIAHWPAVKALREPPISTRVPPNKPPHAHRLAPNHRDRRPLPLVSIYSWSTAHLDREQGPSHVVWSAEARCRGCHALAHAEHPPHTRAHADLGLVARPEAYFSFSLACSRAHLLSLSYPKTTTTAPPQQQPPSSLPRIYPPSPSCSRSVRSSRSRATKPLPSWKTATRC